MAQAPAPAPGKASEGKAEKAEKRALGPLASATLAWRPAVHSVLIAPSTPAGPASAPPRDPPPAPAKEAARETRDTKEPEADRRRPGRARRASSIPLAPGPAGKAGATPAPALLWEALRGLRRDLDALMELCEEPAPQLEASRETP